MDSASHQKILGYFIEEAKEHLETLEQGLMDLSSVVSDPEKINEMFRAAHSIKGGSAMLGYSSIQKTSHRLEDCFKVLREHEVPVDRKLENLFFKGYDTLHELLEQLEGPFGLQDDEAEKVTQASQQDFTELQNYLYELVGGATKPELSAEPTLAAAHPAEAPSPTPEQETAARARAMLQKMLKLFGQKATAANRKALQGLCAKLAKLAPKEKGWQVLTRTAYKAIANPRFSFRTLAPVVIQELKQGSDFMALGQGENIKPSEEFKQMGAAKLPQILIPVEPKAAAQTLERIFNQKQLSEIVQLLSVK